jgi:hypothetical protein
MVLARAREIRQPVWRYFMTLIVEHSLPHPGESQQAAPSRKMNLPE